MVSRSVNLIALIEAAGLPRPELEYPFRGLNGRRRWRWDLAWPDRKVAVERQGGTWTAGRHTRGAGYANDCRKLNEGQLCGWVVLWVTADMVRDGTWLVLIEEALK